MDRSFLRHAAIYGTSTLLIHAGGLFLLPIYLHCLRPAEYGVLEIVNRLAETVGTCLLFGGFRQSLFTFYQQAGNEVERRRVVSSTFLLVLAAAAVGVVALLLLGPTLRSILVSRATGIANPGLLLTLAVISILIEPFSLLPLSLLQARVESTLYAAIVVTQFLFRIGLGILLMRVFHWGVLGALSATTLTGVVFGLGLSGRELSGGLTWPRYHQVRDMVLFALPMLPGGLCFFVLHNGDRFFLSYYDSMEDVGTYALGYKLAMTVRIFSLTPLYMVWSSRMYAVAAQPNASVVFGQMTTRILSAVLFVALGMALFAPEVLTLLGRQEYADAVNFIGPILIVCVLQSAASMMDAGFFIQRRSGLKLGVTLGATAVIVVLYSWLIPVMGAMGAAVATIGGFAFLLVGTYFTTQRLFFVRYEWGRLTALVGLCMLLWWLGRSLPVALWAAGVKVALVSLVPAIVWFSGLINAEEKDHVRRLADLIVGRVRGRAVAAPAAAVEGQPEQLPVGRPALARARAAETPETGVCQTSGNLG